ncbi:MAG: alpha/beta fold hydrolase [Gammaproteobacteria bacterium]
MKQNFPPMPAALDGQREEFDSRAGRISTYVGGDGPPLLLIHSINASGSAYEVKPLYDHYAKTRRVYAPDLPGFGFSERSNRRYDVALYTDAIRVMVEYIAARQPGVALDAVALSLSSEFLARAALSLPDQLNGLAFITPTGFRRGSQRLREPAGSTRQIAWLQRVLSAPLWRRRLFRALTSPRSIRYFLKRTWGSDNIDEGLAAYDDIITNQPGSEFAPLAFLGGGLFSKDIRDVYERLTQQVWLGHGTRGDFKDFSEATWTEQRANWTKVAFDAGALPHFECPDEFFPPLDDFLRK